MTITVREADPDAIQHLEKGDISFVARSKLVLHAEVGRISYTFVDVPPYTKRYSMEEFDANSYFNHPDKIILLAYLGDEPVGQIRLRKTWNGYAYIDLIAIDENFRGQDVGHKLIESAMEWAKAKNLPGIMLETQDTNVPACKFYASCGFELRGFDTHLYKAQDPGTDEIALFWYLMF